MFKVSDTTLENKEVPLVSICVLTYNHEKFIRQALDSLLMQKVDFKVEINVYDDASLDQTQYILKEYNSNYPGIFNLLLQNENQYSKFGGGMHLRFNYPRSKGKYIALCDGDDYWTDPFKLQKQVDYLERNNNCSLVFTNYSIEYDNNKIIMNEGISDYSFNGIFKLNPIRTVSTCFRKSYLNDLTHSWSKDYPFFDLALFLYMASKGKIGLINEYTCVYRYHSSSFTHSRKIESKLNFIKLKFEIRNYFLENFSSDSNLKDFTIKKRLFEGYKATLIYDLDRKYIDVERFNIKKYKGNDIPFALRLLSKNIWLEKICQYFFRFYFSLKKIVN